MKTSNVLLGLWVLLVAGLALLVVYFVRTSGPAGPGGSGDPPAVLPPKTGPQDPKRPGPRDPRDGRAGGTSRRNPPAAANVTGRVVDASGSPVAGATVRLMVPGRPAPAPVTGADAEETRRILQIVAFDDWAPIRPLANWMDVVSAEGARGASVPVDSAQTGEDGKFTVRTPAAQNGPFLLSARHDTLGGASAANVFAGQDVEMVLTSGGVVTGTVTSLTNNGPVPEARVVFDSGEKQWTALSDEAGKFRIEGMPPGRFSVRVGAKGFTPILDHGVQVKRGEDVQLLLPRGSTLRVTAVAFDEDGTQTNPPPIANAEIVAIEEASGVYVTGKTNNFGRVDFDGLPPGSWLVDGRVDGYVSAGGLVVEVHEKDEAVDETVEFEVAVDTPVLVVDDTGLPVAGVEFYSFDGVEGYDVLRSAKLKGETDGQGVWRFPFEWEGPRQQAYAFKKGYAATLVLPEDYTTGEQIRIVLRRAVRVKGRVTDSAGAGVPDALVRLTWDAPEDDPSGEPVTVLLRTNATGDYDFPYVPAGAEAQVDAESSDGDAWSDDMPTVEQKEGVREYTVDLRLETTAPAPKIEMTGPRGERIRDDDEK